MTGNIKLACLDGFASRYFPGVNLARDLAEFDPVSITSMTGLNAWPACLDRWIDRQLPDGPFIACGFSAGATAAARLAERDRNCVGLIYISGLWWEPEPFTARWRLFPALCLATAGEKRDLIDGTEETKRGLWLVGANATFERAPNPNTHRKPHLAGIGHHLPEIRAWHNKHFGG